MGCGGPYPRDGLLFFTRAVHGARPSAVRCCSCNTRRKKYPKPWLPDPALPLVGYTPMIWRVWNARHRSEDFVLPAATMNFRCGVPPPPTGYFSFGKSIQNHCSPAPPSRWSGALRCSTNPAGLELATAPLGQPDPCSGFACASRRCQGRGRAGVQRCYPDGGSATFTLPSIAARRRNQRRLSKPPQVASSRAPRRARSKGVSGKSDGSGGPIAPRTGPPWTADPGFQAKQDSAARKSERSADQGNGAGLLGTFGPSKVPRRAGTEPRIKHRPCRRQHKINPNRRNAPSRASALRISRRGSRLIR